VREEDFETATSGTLDTAQASAKDTGVVEDEEISGAQAGRQVVESPVMERWVVAVED
jgi:hypothetical protein